MFGEVNDQMKISVLSAQPFETVFFSLVRSIIRLLGAPKRRMAGGQNSSTGGVHT